MRCFVYKSLPKADTYLYLARRDDFACVPEPLRRGLGRLGFVLELDLTPERRLARTDPEVLRRNLAECGFHLQLPPLPEAGSHVAG
jgi:uncharacterized protein YcgL (UPF0745 family)